MAGENPPVSIKSISQFDWQDDYLSLVGRLRPFLFKDGEQSSDDEIIERVKKLRESASQPQIQPKGLSKYLSRTYEFSSQEDQVKAMEMGAEIYEGVRRESAREAPSEPSPDAKEVAHIVLCAANEKRPRWAKIPVSVIDDWARLIEPTLRSASPEAPKEKS